MATKKANNKTVKKTVNAAVKRKVVKSTKVVSKSASADNSPANLMANAPFGAMFAEFIGTFVLAAAILSTASTSSNGGSALAMLFVVVALVLTLGHLSGSHLNPALTFGAWISRKISTANAVYYIIAQILGAMLALVVLNALIGGAPAQLNQLGQAQAAPLFKATQAITNKEWYAFFGSMLGMGIFSFAFASALREKKEHIAAAFTIGGGLFIGLIVAGQTAVLNPAAALTVQAFTSLKGDNALTWALAIHIAAPLIGATVGFLLYDLFRRDVDTAV